MTKRLALVTAFTICVGLASSDVRAATADFEDLSLVPPSSEWDGVDTTYNNGSGDYNSFESQGVTFINYHEFSDPWGYGPSHYWDGWAYSNRADISSTGPNGQYTAMGSGVAAHNGANSSSNYGIAYAGWAGRIPTVSFANPSTIQSACFTNNAYAYDSMLNGDAFAKNFGGEDGTDEDWFLLTITGKDALGTSLGSVEFYLADYQSSNKDDDYLINDWTTVSLLSLGAVSSLEFTLTSSDMGDGAVMNTPAYFAMDNLIVVPEPSTFALLVVAGLVAFARHWRRRRS